MREFPQTSRRGVFIRRALATAVAEVLLPRFIEAIMLEAVATRTVSRELCGRSMVYLQARTHFDVCDPARLGPLPGLWERVLGGDDMARLDQLFARLIWAKDGDNGALDRYASEYREIIGPPPPPPPGADEETGHDPAAGRRCAGSDDHDGDHSDNCDQPGVQSLGDALEQAAADVRDSELEQLSEDIDLQQLLKAATKPEPPARGRGRGTGRPSGRLPDRGVERPPMADEVQMARQYARRLHQARHLGLKRIDKRTPGGRFNARAHMRAHAQRTLGVRVSSHPWEITKVITAPLQEPHVGLVVDTSGSMAAWEPFLGPVIWVLSEGLRSFRGRLAVALFGNGARLLCDGSRPLALVPGIKTGGGTAFGGDAIGLCSEQLEFENPRRHGSYT